MSFTYDGLDRRTSKRFRGRVTRWVWDGDVPLHEWHELELGPGAGAVQDLTTWLFEAGSFAPLAKLTADGRAQSVVCDHLGTPLALYDESGALTWEMSLDSYGAVRQGRGRAQDCPFRYQGQYEDSETGLYYNRFRYYDPEAGQYISQDPIGLKGGHRLYSYVSNTQTRLDVFGLASSVTGAINELIKGEVKVTVSTRAEAEKVLYHLQLKDGYTSSAGLNSTAAKDFYRGSRTKTPYYHWDETWEFNEELQEYILENHDHTKSHAREPHLQFHPNQGKDQRVFWKKFERPKVCPRA